MFFGLNFVCRLSDGLSKVIWDGVRFQCRHYLLHSNAALFVAASALVKLADFDDFTPENDPHGEHDFLSFEYCNRTFFWKCDYYNKEMDGGSEDPADSDMTTRVGTLMLAEDY